MALVIRNHRLYAGSRQVEQVRSRFSSGPFRATPKIVVMHFTYGASARSSAEWFRNPSNPGASAHVVIGRDGNIIQCLDLDQIAWHAGKSRWGDLVGLNAHAFGVELANWGYLRETPAGWTSYTGVRIADPVLAVHKNGNPDGSQRTLGWEPYPPVQFDAAVALAQALVTTYGVNEVVGHDDIAKGRKWDPGPAFDMARFRARLFGERAESGDNRMVVRVREGLNLRHGPGLQYAVDTTLPDGTIVEPLEASGAWLCVSVMGENGQPTSTGWVHSHYLRDA